VAGQRKWSVIGGCVDYSEWWM